MRARDGNFCRAHPDRVRQIKHIRYCKGLRFDEQLVSERVERLDVTAIEQWLRIALRVVCGVPNDSL